MHLAGFEYEFRKGSTARTLLLLHGTGGNEKNMIPLGEQLDSDANLLSVRGNVMENGMLRFFRRESPGVFDMKDLESRTKELFKFLDEAVRVHELSRSDLVGVGYSNGANILLYALLQGHPLPALILLRPMSASIVETSPDLKGTRAFVAVGLQDEMAPSADYKKIERTLLEASVDLTLSAIDAGHALTRTDIDAAKEWLATL